MNLKTIRKVQKVLDSYINSTREFLHVLEVIEDKELRKVLCNYALLYGALNIELAKYMLKTVPKAIKQETIDKEFEKLMRQLKNGK